MTSLKELFLHHVAQTSFSPLSLEVKEASGIYIIDQHDRSYIDLISGIAVSSIGHCNPKVVNAIHEQSSKYMHTMVYGEHIQQPQVLLCQKLSQLLPESLNSVYLLNSGSEAVDTAIKLSRKYSGRSKLVACHNAYHGSSTGPLSLMDNAYFSQAYRPLLPNTFFIRFNKVEDLKKIDEDTGAVFIETIQGEAGYIVPNKSYMKALRQRCTKMGALLIMDEIQAGCGRTGQLFAFTEFNIVPDILLLAKGLGGGMPISALITNKAIMDSFAGNPVLGHITTFGGHPVTSAAALATLEVLTDENMLGEVAEKEFLFREKLVHPLIRKISGKGLMLCVHLDSYKRVQDLMHLCFKNGLLTDWFLYKPDAFRIAPPLIITMEEIELSCKIILDVLDNLNQ